MTLLLAFDGHRMLIDKRKKTQSTFYAGRQKPVAVICVVIFFFIFSCASQNIGKLQSSAEITDIFENHQVLSDHAYYYSGLLGVPDAIIGIHPNYSLRTDQWRLVDINPLMLEKWIFRMQTVQLKRPRGAWILDPAGNRVGIWFSALLQTAVRLQQNNRIVIAPPKPPELQGIR